MPGLNRAQAVELALREIAAPREEQVRARPCGVITEKKLLANSSMNASGAAGTPSFTPTSRKTANEASTCAVWLTNR